MGREGMIGCFWHGDIALSITAKVAVIEHKLTRILISLSPDGEFIARSMVRHNMPPIRGSSAKKGKAKGGAAAFREALDLLAAGGILVVTPDGPRGPAQQMAAGTVRIAKRAGVPVFLLGLAARPVLRLNTWDKTKLPACSAAAASSGTARISAARRLGGAGRAARRRMGGGHDRGLRQG